MMIYFIAAIICAGLGYAVATEENKVMGAILGCVLGPIGVIIAVFVK
tara:strand:- start:271 stop:411 length:141 start_codon:yes stop_codon:yes gene_type:complete